MLCLNEKEIAAAVTLDEVMAAIETAALLYEKKEFYMPMRMHADYRDNTLLLMPCFMKERFAVKLVSLFPGNSEKNLPVLMGTLLLNDGDTGAPLALMNAAKLTALRTGAVGGLAVRYLAAPDARSLGVIGAGIQGLHQAMFASRVRNITRVFIYDRLPEKTHAFAHELSTQLPGVAVYPVVSSEELLHETEIIITATNSKEAVLPDREELLAGKHFIGIGSYKPDMKEFPRALFKLLDRVYVDTEHAAEESGDLIEPLKNNLITKDRLITLGKLIMSAGKKTPAKGTTTLFKSVGMALFDLMAADLVYRNAVQKGLGTHIAL
jgi:ornithine cyclodeaminase